MKRNGLLFVLSLLGVITYTALSVIDSIHRHTGWHLAFRLILAATYLVVFLMWITAKRPN